MVAFFFGISNFWPTAASGYMCAPRVLPNHSNRFDLCPNRYAQNSERTSIRSSPSRAAIWPGSRCIFRFSSFEVMRSRAEGGGGVFALQPHKMRVPNRLKRNESHEQSPSTLTPFDSRGGRPRSGGKSTAHTFLISLNGCRLPSLTANYFIYAYDCSSLSRCLRVAIAFWHDFERGSHMT